MFCLTHLSLIALYMYESKYEGKIQVLSTTPSLYPISTSRVSVTTGGVVKALTLHSNTSDATAAGGGAPHALEWRW